MKKKQGFLMLDNRIPLLNIRDSELRILILLSAQMPGYRMSFKDIMDRTWYSKRTVLQVIRNLESYNMIKRINNPHDKNIYEVLPFEKFKYQILRSNQPNCVKLVVPPNAPPIRKIKSGGAVSTPGGGVVSAPVVGVVSAPQVGVVELPKNNNTKTILNYNTKRKLNTSTFSDSSQDVHISSSKPKKKPKPKFNQDHLDEAEAWISWTKENCPHIKLNKSDCAAKIAKLRDEYKLNKGRLLEMAKNAHKDEFWQDKVYSPVRLWTNRWKNGQRAAEALIIWSFHNEKKTSYSLDDIFGPETGQENTIDPLKMSENNIIDV